MISIYIKQKVLVTALLGITPGTKYMISMGESNTIVSACTFIGTYSSIALIHLIDAWTMTQRISERFKNYAIFWA